MVRTVADGRKAVGSKAPRKQFGGGGGGGSSSASNASSISSNNPNFGLVNHAKMWPTPTWQKGIGNFFKKCERPQEEDLISQCQGTDTDVVATTCSSSGGDCGESSSSNYVIYSDDDDKENTDPASSSEGAKSKQVGRSSLSDSGSPSPKIRKANGKQKAGTLKRKKRAVFQDSDEEE